ncbi:MAG: Gfo/Idh/MocA family oxidoreductase [Pirellulales bacterium]|nr:Gfo/Idh/MocA family oxidoreductase [Pirellulales bacterium]
MAELQRRTFLSAATAAGLAAASRLRAADASRTVTLALMGANNRGSDLARQFVKQDGVRFAYVCDPDERAIEKGIAAAAANGGPRPKGVRDFREALDDPGVDALICAAPNHWHAPATILACAAGKHVYVEKPCSHTAAEGEMMIAAARNHSRTVQVGTQRRSGSLYRSAVEKIHGGALGNVLHARCWYYTLRPSIGKGNETAPPDWLDYSLWQGPAPERPFRDNILHYNWHFFWHWGNAELGNNGVHLLDICRWALEVDFPTRVTAAGGHIRYDDDQQTPDTSSVVYQCGDKMIAWEHISWTRPVQSQSILGIEFRGTDGTMYIDDDGYVIHDPQRKVVEKQQGSRGDAEHIADFLAAVRNGGGATNADVEEGHKSALFCHVGNIAYRLGSSIDLDPATGHIRDNAEAQKLWTREYRQGWEPKV